MRYSRQIFLAVTDQLFSDKIMQPTKQSNFM